MYNHADDLYTAAELMAEVERVRGCASNGRALDLLDRILTSCYEAGYEKGYSEGWDAALANEAEQSEPEIEKPAWCFSCGHNRLNHDSGGCDISGCDCKQFNEADPGLSETPQDEGAE